MSPGAATISAATDIAKVDKFREIPHPEKKITE